MLELNGFNLKSAQSVLIDNLSFKVGAGEILTIMGPSGSGKSSLLRYIGGFVSSGLQVNGDIFIDGERLNDVPPELRRVGILFQDDLLFPHLDVFHNLTLGIPNKYSRAEKKELVLNVLKSIDLEQCVHFSVDKLSGGQRSRIALWRTLLSEPRALLLDEPFSRLDLALKIKVRAYFSTVIKKRNLPTLLVTHDHEDRKWAAGDLIDLTVSQS